ncbi:response regulator [Vulgatibacter incomptus]|uniref:Response regulator n=1 Tax=Vulgatibacter incomptus TaxID=1391653 RepID=A0A0K1PDM2_9BACT|nr:response regulator [Vulgatibacter incomptus]AKU91620.1 Response regulator [Vulgatibacter incomptus]
MSETIKVVVIDDDPLQLELVSRLIGPLGFEVITIESPIGATNIVRRAAPDVVLLDVNIPTLPGEQLMELMRNHAPKHTKFAFYSSADELELRRLAMAVGADGWIQKTVPVDELVRKLRELAARPVGAVA